MFLLVDLKGNLISQTEKDKEKRADFSKIGSIKVNI